MGTKMKGVLKGLRYITQIFEDEKEQDMQIGFPTDVKHVADIGWDGPSPTVDNSPSWMKEYKSPEGTQRPNEEGKENSDSQWGSQDSLSQRNLVTQANPSREFPDLPKSSRRHPLADGSSTSRRHSLADGSSPSSPKGSKSRQSRRNSSESSKSSRKPKDPVPGSESPSRILPGLPKKSSRKKSKESSTGGSRRSRTKDVPLDPGQDPGPTSGYDSNKLVHSSSLRSSVKEEEKG